MATKSKKSSGSKGKKFGWMEVGVAIVGGAALGVVGTLMIRPAPALPSGTATTTIA
jgi:hypothetical protein